MANYDSNYAIAQEISARIGTKPVPFDSVYSICLAIYQELGGEKGNFDSVYSILLEILPLATEAAHVIDDNIVSTVKTWSSSKIASELAIAGFNTEIVEELPVSGNTHTIYFVPESSTLPSGSTDVYDEFIYIDNEWEQIGSTRIDLSDYYTVGEINALLDEKQDTLVAGEGIEISGNTISTIALTPTTGYNYATKYIDDDTNLESTNIATGSYSNWAEGSKTTATSTYGGNHAEGYSTSATGQYGSHSEGAFTESSEIGSHSEGYSTKATARGAHAEGEVTLASGEGSHAEGWGLYSQNYPNNAIGGASHVEGSITIARNKAEHAEGAFNVSHKSSNNMGDSGNTLSSIGFHIGDNFDSIFKNAREVMQNADMYIYGIGGYDGVHIKGEDSGITVHTVQDVIANIFVQLSSLDARVTALEPQPEPTQPNDEIWYTTSDGEIILIGGSGSGSGSGSGGGWPQVLSNTYEDGKGVIKFAEDLTEIPQEAFYQNYYITSIVIPNSVTSIADGAFYFCPNLTSVTLSDNVTSIGDMAFGSNAGLTSIILPSSVTTLGYDTFAGCSNLATITCEPTTPPTIGEYAFDEIHWPPVIYVPAESVNAYKTAENWDFLEDCIQAISE